jgi:hypothetical protein
MGPWDSPPEWIKNHAIEIRWTNAEQERHKELAEELKRIFMEECRRIIEAGHAGAIPR